MCFLMKGEALLKDKFFKTVRHFFPELNSWLDGIRDPRNPNKTEYEPREVLWPGLLIFSCKLGARRQSKFNFNTPEFFQNFQRLTSTAKRRICSHDTTAYLCEKLNPQELRKVLGLMAQRLIRMRALERWRLLGQYYLVALDGTGLFVFEEPHCAYCLQKRIHGRTFYYHHVLVASLVTPNGLSIPVDFEFIDNRDVDPLLKDKSEDKRKQDCELKAFYRLEPRLKALVPQLRLCLLLDALYAGQGVFDRCERNRWKFLITFKEGSMPSVFQEYESLKRLSMPQPSVAVRQGIRQECFWVNQIAYESHTLNVLECLQPTVEKGRHFCWLTNIPVTKKNYSELSNEGGRQRWKIENQGFNIEKNGGYGLEHAYSLDPIGMLNFLTLLLIAHVIAQLLEKGSLLGKAAIEALGGLRNVADRLLESLRMKRTTPAAYDRLFAAAFQIRLEDTS